MGQWKASMLVPFSTSPTAFPRGISTGLLFDKREVFPHMQGLLQVESYRAAWRTGQ